MYLFRYRIVVDGDETERTYRAASEQEAFQRLEFAYPRWESVELIHTMQLVTV